MINRRVTRTIKETTETTASTQTPKADTLAFNIQTTEKFYVGFREKFTTRYFHMGTVNDTASVLTVKYWNGTEFTAVEDLVDQTISSGKTFGKSGFISWDGVSGWQTSNQTPVTDQDLYWAEFTFSIHLHADTTLQSVLNLFVDADSLSMYYPELISDSRYLPSGQSDFVPQYVAASNLVSSRLEQKNRIHNIDEILEPNSVAIPAAHAAAWCIYNGLSGKSEELEKSQSDAWDAFTSELNAANDAFDFDNSGKIDDVEREIGTEYIARR